ncbi:DedA family protein [Nocardioides sp. MAHUQ-72]|uniref:DedA family protein n=1 Tax=unclassified Nocardioides TaxID=2615069 RepID=UPI003623EA34
MGNLVGHVTSLLTSVPAPLALAVIGALVFAEAALFVGFVLPGETAVLLGGALASAGHLSFAELLVVVVVAAIVGDSVGYEVGRLAGPHLLESRLLRRHRARLEVARSRLQRKGGVTVVAGRFTALLRAVTPGLCGMSGMPYRRFLLFNALGALAWGTAVCVLGFVAGKSYQRVEASLGGVGAVLLLLFVVAGVVLWHRGRAARTAALSDRDDPSR